MMIKHSKEGKDLSTTKTKWIVLPLVFFTIYAIIRYIVFKGVSTNHLPLYIVNKIFSISGIFLIAASYTIGKLKRLKNKDESGQHQLIKFIGLAGFSLSAMHVFISLMIITPGYFPKFFHEGMMNFKGELSMLLGVFSLFCFSFPAITTLPFMQEAVGVKKWKKRQQIGYLGLVNAFLHVLVMGFSGWLDMASWPGYLPPITMIGALIAFVPLVLKLLRKS
jgi:DMSO/TMAO reductase YedYZ heme-binding membrane subunit